MMAWCLPTLSSRLIISILAALLFTLAGSSTFAIDDNLTKGATNNHVFEAGIWGEYIDTLNGGLNLSIPIGPEYKVSADLSYQLKLTYSSKIWELNESNFNRNSRSRLRGRGQAGLGFSLHMGRMYRHVPVPECQNAEWVYEDSTGAAHPADDELIASDGSFLRISNSTPSVETPGGQYLRFGPLVYDILAEPNPSDSSLLPPCDAFPGGLQPDLDILTNDYRGHYVVEIDGKDGGTFSRVDIEYETDPGMKHLMNKITNVRNGFADTAHAITFTNSNAHPTNPGAPNLKMGYVTSITLPAFGGQTATYTFTYAVETIHDPFVYQIQNFNVTASDNAAGTFEVLLLKEITFPNGYEMKFEYTRPDQTTNFGLLIHREVPTGATVDYDYGSYPFAHSFCHGAS